MDFQKNKFKNQQKNGNGSNEKDKSYEENHLEKEMDIDYDIIHLKDHLNASFDKDNIVVSEELIQKTLQAIQSGSTPSIAEEDYQEENDKIEYENDKKNRWSIFRLASIAAVLLLLLVGLNALKYLQFGSKKEMAVKEDRTTTSDVADSNKVSMEESATENKKTKEADVYSIAAETAEQEVSEESADISSNIDESAFKDGKNEVSETQEPRVGMLKEGNILFSDILPFTAEQVTSFTIINSKDEAVSFENTEKTNEFLLLLNDYPLLLIENEEDTMENQWDYQIKFTSQDDLSYTILVGNEIQLKTDNNNNDIIRYSIMGDVDQLKSRLNEYISN